MASLYQDFTTVLIVIIIVTDTRGFDLPKIVRDIGTFVQGRMTSETQLNVPAGPSHVALVIPYISSAVSDSDRDYINNKLYSYSQTIPGTTLFYYKCNQFVSVCVCVWGSSYYFCYNK